MSRPSAADVIDLARTRGMTLGSAESLTGGAISVAMTTVAGASDVWRGAVVAYAPRVKTSVLAVPSGVLDEAGIVSAPTALAMATGARRLLAVDVAVSTTGVAGPTTHGGMVVGSVVIAVVGPDVARAEKFHFSGGRQSIVDQSVEAALCLIFAALEGAARGSLGIGEQP